ncbi:MAG: hypothetical protein VX416_02205, partial [Pseudomonadota bacterium]|nr:hypothetical protein [Pseudomonadota bacterium]
ADMAGTSADLAGTPVNMAGAAVEMAGTVADMAGAEAGMAGMSADSAGRPAHMGGMSMGGADGTGGVSAPANNQLMNGDFEDFEVGAGPPFDPPTDWLAFSTATSDNSAVGYSNFATQANGAPTFPTNVPYPGWNDSRGAKMWGRGLDDGNGNRRETLSTVYQEFKDGTVPSGSALTLTGYAYHFSDDALAPNNEVYLVIKCFSAGYAANLCGDAASVKITSNTPTDQWIYYEVTVPALPEGTEIVQAGMEFHECVGGPCNTARGAIFFDELVFTY